MESFDESLKFLLHQEPADFLRFGFADPDLTILEPCETDLPSRDRDIDGSYFVVREGVKMVAHVEFHRRHQSVEELAIDVAEAQIRLYRRERCLVVTHVWDLYGDRAASLMAPRMLQIGPGSYSTYARINLRAMEWQELLASGPPALWPLVPLAQNGATEVAVKTARDAISSRHAQNSSRRADHLAVLWFVAEAEDVPTELIKAYIKEEQLMESALYKSIFSQGEARLRADTIHRLLTRWLGPIDANVCRRMETFPDQNVVEAWRDEAFDLNDTESARKLLTKILETPVPPAAGSSQAA